MSESGCFALDVEAFLGNGGVEVSEICCWESAVGCSVGIPSSNSGCRTMGALALGC